MVVRQVLVSGPITALRRLNVAISVRSTSGPRSGRKEGPPGRKGSVTPLRCENVGS